jgi:hypothetical protein
MGLLALVDRAIPVLERAAHSSSWSIRASAIHILGANHFETSGVLKEGLGQYLEDPHPVVRAVAAMSMGASTPAMEILSRPEEASFSQQCYLPIFAHQDWLPEPYYTQRLDRFLELLDSPAPLIEPVELLQMADRARLNPLVQVGQSGLLQELQGTSHGHEVSDKLLKKILSVGTAEEDRLGVLLSAAYCIVEHHDASHPETGECSEEARYTDALCSVVENRLWSSKQDLLLHSALFVLNAMASAGYERASKLLERISREHPDERVRESAEWDLKQIASLREGGAAEELRRALRAERARKAKEKLQPPMALNPK